MDNVILVDVNIDDKKFLYQLMNNEILMEILAEKSTNEKHWEKAIEVWKTDKDEGNFIIYNLYNLPIGWIGINGLLSQNKTIWIKIIAILPKYWGQGYGSITIEAIKKYYSSKNYKFIKLWTDKNNQRSRNCYKKNGFEIIKKDKRIVGSRQEIRERLLLKCKL